jgi:ABC-type transporter Mla maintaining outer membrane lipid asymmetry ATPase subunit MlaF
MIANPYRWQHDRPAHVLARDDLVGQIERHLRRGVAVKLVGGRGMGKSVLLRQVQARFASEPDTRAVLVPGPPEEGTLAACVQDIAKRLGLDPLAQRTMDAVPRTF